MRAPVTARASLGNVDPHRMHSMSADQLAHRFAADTDFLMVLLEAMHVLEDPRIPPTSENFVRRLGWCKARLVCPLLFPKMAGVAAPGSLHLERVTCGKPNCRCADGNPSNFHQLVHHRWWDGQRLRSEYVPSSLRSDMQQAIDLWHAQHPGDGRRSDAERARKRAFAAAWAGAPHRRRPFQARASP